MQTKFHYCKGHQMCLEVHATQVWNIEQTIMPKYDCYFVSVWMWVQVQVKLIWRKGLKMEKWKSKMSRSIYEIDTCLLYLGETNDKGGKGIEDICRAMFSTYDDNDGFLRRW